MNRSYRILLVEDSRTQAMNLSGILEHEGWQVDWSPTVEEAIEKLAHESPDMIVLDYYLPGMRGDEFCRRIRMNINTRNIPILMLTAEETQDAELHGLESGADNFVPKSVDSAILLARIRTLLNKSGVRSSICGVTDQDFRRARLLTIDDSLTYQQYLAAELEQEGYRIEKAMSGREGLERIVKEPFDCVLVDLMMPDMNGIELCRQVNHFRRLTDNSVALLMLTGRETKEDLTQALEAGADDFVGKSSDMAVLKGRIAALLRRKFYQADNRRIAEQLKNNEVELLRAKADKELFEARAALSEELERRVDQRTAELADANRDLAQRNQENEMFVYSASHDLRSPLINLQAFSQELVSMCRELREILTTCDSSDGERERGLTILDGGVSESIGFIQTAVTRLSTIINALLRLSRAGRVEYVRQEVDVQEIVERIVESMNSVIVQRNAELALNDLPPAWGDPTAIEQIFANLIGNALNYLDPARPGLIEVGDTGVAQHHQFTSPIPHVTYYVKDNGLGIPTAHQPQVFQAFKRLHPEAAPGEGMGLAMVHRIVERHGGHVWLESQAGVGTVFYVALPSIPALMVTRGQDSTTGQQSEQGRSFSDERTADYSLS